MIEQSIHSWKRGNSVTKITQNPSYRFAFHATNLAALLLASAAACNGGDGGAAQPAQDLQVTVGAGGGEIAGGQGTALEGVKLVVPAGAVANDTVIGIKAVATAAPLPVGLAAAGKQFELSPAGLQFALPAQLTLPVDTSQVEANLRFANDVNVSIRNGEQFGRLPQLDGRDGSVTVELSSLPSAAGADVSPPGPQDIVRFDLHPNPKFLNCFAQFPGDATRAPSARVTVIRGSVNDELTLRGSNIKPGLHFDLFTVQRSTLAADGSVDPTVTNFGLAAYESDVAAKGGHGEVRVKIQTVLLDDPFAFDPAAGLPPVNTFHLGFWFDNPDDAAPCGFDPAHPTPFNGDHVAGPLAMITVPDAASGLGPLCTNPDTSTVPAHCGP
jgi:hypothetical protein